MSTACFAQFSLCGFFVFYMYERVLVLTSLYGACVSSCSKYKSYVTAVPLVWHLLCLPLNDDHIIEVHFISLPCSFVSGLVLSLIVTIVHTRYSYPASWFCLFFPPKCDLLPCPDRDLLSSCCLSIGIFLVLQWRNSLQMHTQIYHISSVHVLLLHCLFFFVVVSVGGRCDHPSYTVWRLKTVTECPNSALFRSLFWILRVRRTSLILYSLLSALSCGLRPCNSCCSSPLSVAIRIQWIASIPNLFHFNGISYRQTIALSTFLHFISICESMFDRALIKCFSRLFLSFSLSPSLLPLSKVFIL